MLTILLYNSGLELLNSLTKKELNHPSIKNDIKRRKKDVNKILLDLVIHQPALLSNSKLNRGRPDIVHICLLQYLFSPLVLENKNDLKFIIHSVNDTYFEVPHSWRPPTHFYRFRGLMEQFLERKKLKVSNKEKMTLQEGSVEDVLGKLQFEKVIAFTSHGESIGMQEFSEKMSSYLVQDSNFIILIGGFQHGGIPENIAELLKTKSNVEKITLPGGRLPSWKVLSNILYVIEMKHI